jgi:single stranded DNA-binding protein
MTDINIATLTGRLVRDPILRNGDGGTLIGNFTLASNKRYKDKAGAVQEETAFLPCKAFGRWAERWLIIARARWPLSRAACAPKLGRKTAYSNPN